MEWFRMYHGVLHDPKVHRLTIVRRWRWVEILCIASMHGKGSEEPRTNDRFDSDNSQGIDGQSSGKPVKRRGMLPSIDDMAFLMRIKRQECESIIADLIRVGLIDELPDGKGLVVHDWDEHQRPSDDTARRVRDWRAQQKQPSSNGPVTLQETLPLRNSNVLDSEREKTKTKDVLRPSSSSAASHASPASPSKRRSANPTPAPPEVVANDPTFARIAAEDERVRRSAERDGDH